MMLLEKVCDTLLSAVCAPAVVGLADVLQHTPLAVTVAPPLDVTFPPDVAVVGVILLAATVVTFGGVGEATG